MTLEPTDDEVAAYGSTIEAYRKEHGAQPYASWELLRVGLRGVYAKLEERLYGADPTALGPGAVLEQNAPPLMEYDSVFTVEQLQMWSSTGWRLANIIQPTETAPRPIFVLERERPEPPERQP